MSVPGDIETVLGAAVPLSVPLLFGGLGEYVAQRSGAFDLSVEGMMLSGAFFAAYGATVSGSLPLGILLGVVAGMAVGLIHANLSHRLQLNTYVVGLSLNVFILGVTNFLLKSTTIDFPSGSKLAIPGLSQIPVIGGPFFDEPWLAYVIIGVIALVWFVRRTKVGLQMRAAGDEPAGADLTGIKVNARRRQAVIFCGLCAGAGGSFLAIFESGSFTSDMTAGRGYIVIAAVIFGGWTLRGVIGACALFGVAEALQIALPAIGVSVSAQLLAAMPYLLAAISLALLGRRLREPLALGQPFLPPR